MKTRTLLSLVALMLINVLGLTACKKTAEDDFNDANGDTVEKLIDRISIKSDDTDDIKDIVVSYDDLKRVNKIVYDENSHYFIYDEYNNLSKISAEDGLKDINSLFLAPYDMALHAVFDYNYLESGNVLKYDTRGNPVEMEIFDNTLGWDWYTGYYIVKVDTLRAEIEYDTYPNPIFYTLKAGKIIDVLDRVDLSYGSQSAELIKARQLLPYNNIKTITFKNLKGTTQSEIIINTIYDSDKYPTTANIIETSSGGRRSEKLITYFYK